MTKAYWSGYPAELGERMRAAREKHDLSCAGAAQLIGMTPQRLNALEGGRIEQKAHDILLIARLTGVDLAELLMGEEQAPIPIPDDPALRRRPKGEAARTRNRRARQAERAVEPRRRPGPSWRPANLGRDARPTVGKES